MKKRDFLRTTVVLGAGIVLKPSLALPGLPGNGTGLEFELPVLGFTHNALEPVIDTKTMEIHYGKHHAAYVANLNAAIPGNPRFQNRSIDYLLNEVKSEETAIRNNGGGHWNHSSFWKWITPGGIKEPPGLLMDDIIRSFGSFDEFKQLFSEAAKNRFGSGWAWLSLNSEKKLFVSSTSNQDNPLMKHITDQPGTPILGIDVWEHAYYLKYQNKRTDYIEGFFSIINWDTVMARYLEAIN